VPGHGDPRRDQAGRQGAAARHHRHAGRRPGQAGRQHDHGHGLEARVPFLDHDLVELAARIPAEHKLSHGGKGVLKEAARKVIPHEVIDRKKGYFPVPALKYIEGPYLDMVRGALTSQAAGSAASSRELSRTPVRRPTEHITPLRGSELWQVAVLELWLQEHGI
jgi:asparagine synthase (glutamine-hydrolysing)